MLVIVALGCESCVGGIDRRVAEVFIKSTVTTMSLLSMDAQDLPPIEVDTSAVVVANPF